MGLESSGIRLLVGKSYILRALVLRSIKLRRRAVEHTKRRLKISGYSPNITLGDAESLAFPDESFDIVYSWGVLHHSPNTLQAINEVKRVLKVGGIAKIMDYHTWSFVGYMLWVRYALLRGGGPGWGCHTFILTIWKVRELKRTPWRRLKNYLHSSVMSKLERF
jgi:ubiquinone/menaquinone biosynthesis C-methylase UbiE